MPCVGQPAEWILIEIDVGPRAVTLAESVQGRSTHLVITQEVGLIKSLADELGKGNAACQ